MILKTPTAMDAEIGSPKREPKSGDSGCLAQELLGGYARILPTPVAQDYRRRDPNSRQQGLPEVCYRLLNTPIADGLKKRTGKGQERMSAEDFEAMFPEYFEAMFPENGGSPGSKDGRAFRLNPLFIGEMMGYPLEWLTSPFLSGDGEGRP